MVESIIYLLTINPDPKGDLEIDGERFVVYEEIDPKWEHAFKSERNRYIDSFIQQLRKTRSQGDPKKNLEIIIRHEK